MLVEMRFEYLAHYPDLIPVLAHWHVAEWGGLYEDWKTEVAEAEFYSQGVGGIPTTIVLLEGSELVGSVSLIETDLDTLPPYTPWLASLFVHPDFRGRGLGKMLVARAIGEAAKLGVERLYLFTPEHEAFYRKLGWEVEGYYPHLGVQLPLMTTKVAAQRFAPLPDSTPT
jgi:GNAT superfamily N-acetyltransferase